MTHEEAIKYVKLLEPNDESYSEEEWEKYKTAKKMAIKALENSRWIPVTEKLPEKEGYYLVTKAFYDCNYKALNGRILVDRVWIQPWCLDDTIVAWMEDPTPFPYKKGVEE